MLLPQFENHLQRYLELFLLTLMSSKLTTSSATALYWLSLLLHPWGVLHGIIFGLSDPSSFFRPLVIAILSVNHLPYRVVVVSLTCAGFGNRCLDTVYVHGWVI